MGIFYGNKVILHLHSKPDARYPILLLKFQIMKTIRLVLVFAAMVISPQLFAQDNYAGRWVNGFEMGGVTLMLSSDGTLVESDDFTGDERSGTWKVAGGVMSLSYVGNASPLRYKIGTTEEGEPALIPLQPSDYTSEGKKWEYKWLDNGQLSVPQEWVGTWHNGYEMGGVTLELNGEGSFLLTDDFTGESTSGRWLGDDAGIDLYFTGEDRNERVEGYRLEYSDECCWVLIALNPEEGPSPMGWDYIKL